MRNIILFSSLIFFASQSYAFTLKGVATPLDAKGTAYTESHKVELDSQGLNKRIETTYTKANGEVFAEMTSDFSKHPTLPDIKFTDKRFSLSEEMTVDLAAKTVTMKVSKKGVVTKSKTLPLKEGMAAGQGFDNFVKMNFESLKSTTVPLSFGVLAKADFFSFKGSKKSDLSDNKVQFKIDLSSFFLRLFAHELLLEYDGSTKKILNYKGLSNIQSDSGATQSVNIKYEVLPAGT